MNPATKQTTNNIHPERNLWSIDKWGPDVVHFRSAQVPCGEGYGCFLYCHGESYSTINIWQSAAVDIGIVCSILSIWTFNGQSHNYMVWTCTIEPVGKTCSIQISSIAMIFWSCCKLSVPNQRTVAWAWLQIFHAPETCGFYWVYEYKHSASCYSNFLESKHQHSSYISSFCVFPGLQNGKRKKTSVVDWKIAILVQGNGLHRSSGILRLPHWFFGSIWGPPWTVLLKVELTMPMRFGSSKKLEGDYSILNLTTRFSEIDLKSG